MSKTTVTVLSIAVLVAGWPAQIKAGSDQIVTLTTSGEEPVYQQEIRGSPIRFLLMAP